MLGASLILTACANIGPPEPPSLNLPKPPSDLRAARKGNSVTLSWTIPTVTTDRQNLRRVGPTSICRGLVTELKECGVPVGQATAEELTGSTKQKKTIGKKSSGPKVSESYTDHLPGTLLSDNPASYLIYTVEVLNTDGRGAGLSNQVQVSLVRTPSPPPDLSAHVTANGVVLSWTNEAPAQTEPGLRYFYRVYRRQEDGSQPTPVAELPADTEPTLAFTDSTIEWQKTYEYFVEAVTVATGASKTELQVPGEDSAEVKVFANDTFPPAVPSGLQAAYSGPGQQPYIDLIWAPDVDTDLAGYNVYRSEAGAAPTKINSELIKAPVFKDTQVEPGKTYVYSVSAVDTRGNESAHSEPTSETVP